MYIEKPNKIKEKIAILNPPIQVLMSPQSGTKPIHANMTGYLPLSKVVEWQK